MPEDVSRNELSRLKAEYLARDARHLNKDYSYQNPAFVYHMQEREWAILSLLREQGVDLSTLDVLEVGCGTGHILQRFLEFGVKKAAGIELMEHRVKQGATRYPKVLLAQGDASLLPYGDSSFDCVMQFMCLSSVLDRNMRGLISAEMWRVLKPGGIILSYDMRPTSGFVSLCYRAFRSIKFLGRSGRDTAMNQLRATPTKALDISEIRGLFKARDVAYCSVSLNLKIARVASTSHLLVGLLSRLPWFRTHYIALIRKPF